jgi:hypothetical protein
MNDQERAEHHEHGATCAWQNADTYRSYLTWSGDLAEREWAQRMADAAEAEARAQSTFAAALRARAKESAGNRVVDELCGGAA